MNKGNVKKFCDLFDKYNIKYEFKTSDPELIELTTRNASTNCYVIFLPYNNRFYAYNLNTDLVPSDLYGDLKHDEDEDQRQIRQESIMWNIKRLLGGRVVVEEG